MTKHQTPLFGGKPVEEWDLSWVRVPGGLERHQSQLTEEVGLYRYTLNGRSMALGTGTDKKGGIAKRLSDFIRLGWSGRYHHAGQLIFGHRDRLEVWVLITGSGPYARKIARLLKAPMMALHQPAWNAPDTSSVAKAKARRRRSAVKATPVPRPYMLPKPREAGTTQPAA
ncbi:hypothetical protein [Brevundimonas sp. R86498]|uniref:hypothetical protein n=1 Tax=Brevundimonas sp. R86498 TaxID=3093845 RepID=UPI0037C912B2